MPSERPDWFGSDCTCVHALDLYCTVLAHLCVVSDYDVDAVGVERSVPNRADGG